MVKQLLEEEVVDLNLTDQLTLFLKFANVYITAPLTNAYVRVEKPMQKQPKCQWLRLKSLNYKIMAGFRLCVHTLWLMHRTDEVRIL